MKIALLVLMVVAWVAAILGPVAAYARISTLEKFSAGKVPLLVTFIAWGYIIAKRWFG